MKPDYDEEGYRPIYQTTEEIEAIARASRTTKDKFKLAFQGIVTFSAILILGYIALVVSLGFLSVIGYLADEWLKVLT